MSEFKIKPATRQGVKPLIGLYGKSGSGKTYSALLLARGIVGPSGRIVLIDSERGRGSIFADLIPGGYNTLEIDEPYSPARYIGAIDTAESQADCVVIDSLSHEWESEGGVLEMQEAELTRMAGNDWGKRESCKMAAWIKPKQEHKKLVGRILRARCALICCLRAQEKTHIEKKEGKIKVFTDAFSSPIYDPKFIFELLVNGETIEKNGVGGYVVWRKITHRDVGGLLPGESEQISTKHGEALMRWCSNPAGGKTTDQSSSNDRLQRFLIATKHLHQKMLAYAIDKAILMPDQTLDNWPEDQIPTTKSGFEKFCRDVEAHV